MLIYKDIITNSELGSDSYKRTDRHGGVIFELDGKLVLKGGDQIVLDGANPSAEEEQETLEESVVKVINIVDAHKLEQSPVDKKGFIKDIKAYMKRIKTIMEGNGKSAEEVNAFQTNAEAAVKEILKSFQDYEVYRGEQDSDLEGMPVLCNYREDGVTPYLVYFTNGVIEEKF